MESGLAIDKIVGVKFTRDHVHSKSEVGRFCAFVAAFRVEFDTSNALLFG